MCEKTLIFNVCEVTLFVRETLVEERKDPFFFPLKRSSRTHFKPVHHMGGGGYKMVNTKPEMTHRQREETNALREMYGSSEISRVCSAADVMLGNFFVHKSQVSVIQRFNRRTVADHHSFSSLAAIVVPQAAGSS